MTVVQQIIVAVTTVYYPKDGAEGDWYAFATKHGEQDLKCSGKLPFRPHPGEQLKLTGKYDTYQGQRVFKVRSAVPHVPENERDLLAYVCHRSKGIGPAMEDAIWHKFHEDWRAVTEGSVPRLTGRLWFAFQETLQLVEVEAEKSAAISWLMGKGATANMSAAAWELWKSDTIGIVMNDPYRLADLPNYGFIDVDGSIRMEFGICDADHRRVKAACVYSLKQLTSSGSTVVEWPVARDHICKLIGAHYVQLVADCVTKMFEDGALAGFPGSRMLALVTDYRNERDIWEWINVA